MRPRTIVSGLLAFGSAALLSAPTASAQTNPAHTHMGHVADGFRGTPDGKGLLPTAVAEAATASQHAGLAARDPNNLQAMITHAGHVIHALDPSVVATGPGAGYGVKAAASGVARHIELAAGSEGASDNVKTHATHIATAANDVVTWTDQAVAIAKQIQAASDAETANELVHELMAKLEAITNGVDANGDGRTGWQEGEGGLAQATTHLGLMQRGEGAGG